MSSVNAYREALRGALGRFADMLQPIQTPLPAERQTWNLRSDKAHGEDELTLESVLPRTQGTCNVHLPLLPTKNHKVSIPGAKHARVGVQAETECTAILDMRDGLPSIEIGFSRPVAVHNAMDFAGFRYLSPTCTYNLEKIYMNRDGSIDIDGSVRMLHLISKRYKCQVREPTASVHNHSVVELFKGAAQTLFTTVPGFVLKPLSFFVPTTDETIGSWASMLESAAPLVETGRLTWEGTFTSPKPTVIRLDSADVILPAQVCQTTLIADILPGPRKVSLVTHPGTQLRSKSGDIDFSGTLGVSPTALIGNNVRASVKAVRADVLLSTGQKDETLVPVRIDARHETEPVAQGSATFVVAKHSHFDGRLAFSLPARVVDTNRLVHTDSCDINVDKVELDVVLSGRAARGTVTRDVQVNLDVPTLALAGRLDLKPEVAERFKTVTTLPLNVHLGGHPQPPFSLQAQYSAPDQGVARGGAAMAFDLLCDLQEPNLLRIDGAAGHALVDRMAVATQGAVRFGSMAHDARRSLEGEMSVRANQLGARIFLNPITLDSMHLEPGTVLETQPSPDAKPAVNLLCHVEQLPGKEIQVHGQGRADIPVKLDTLGPLEILLTFGRGPARMVEAVAKLCLKPLRFHWSPTGYGASGDLDLRYDARLKGRLQQADYNVFGSEDAWAP